MSIMNSILSCDFSHLFGFVVSNALVAAVVPLAARFELDHRGIDMSLNTMF